MRAFAVHPGTIIETSLIRHTDPEMIRGHGAVDEDGRVVRDPARQLKSIEQGAATTVWCATGPQLEGRGGVHCENCDISPLVAAEDEAAWRSATGPVGVLPYAVDPDAAVRLWEISEQLIA